MTKLGTASVGHFNGQTVNPQKATVLLEFLTGKDPERFEVKSTAGESYYSPIRSFLSGKTELMPAAARCHPKGHLIKSTPDLNGLSLKIKPYELTNAYVPAAEERVHESCSLTTQSMIAYYPTKLMCLYEN